MDALWRTPEAHEAMGRFAVVTGRAPSDIAAIAVTHPHSDHYGGLDAFRAAAPGAPALATRTAARVIGNDEHGFYASRREDLGDDIPAAVPTPEVGVTAGRPLEAGGVALRPLVLRGNEAIETAMLYHPESRVLFTADVVRSAN